MDVVWGVGAVVVVAALLLGRLFGKLSAVAKLQVLEERLANKDDLQRRQQEELLQANEQIVQSRYRSLPL